MVAALAKCLELFERSEFSKHSKAPIIRFNGNLHSVLGRSLRRPRTGDPSAAQFPHRQNNTAVFQINTAQPSMSIRQSFNANTAIFWVWKIAVLFSFCSSIQLELGRSICRSSTCSISRPSICSICRP
jgi:hypothetical protein